MIMSRSGLSINVSLNRDMYDLNYALFLNAKSFSALTFSNLILLSKNY